MERILERYERYSYAERQLVTTDTETNGSWTLEHAKLKARVEILQKNQRHFMGEELDTLSLKELQNLEQQIDSALKNIRSRKNTLMYESISELQKKDKALQEQNNQLAKTVKEKEKENAMAQQTQWEQQNQAVNPSNVLLQQPMNLSGTYPAGGSNGEDETTPIHNRANTLLPAWMLPHFNE